MPNRTGFQSFVNNELPIAVPGDFASANPRATVVGGPGAYVAPQAGTNVGAFAWFDPSTGIASNYYKPNAFLAFVHRQNNALITTFLGIASTQVVPGNPVADGFVQGDFYAAFQSGASTGQSVYANPVTGAATAGSGASVTGSATATTVTSGVLTATTADETGTAPAVGAVVTGGTLPEGTYIASSAGTGSGTTLWNLANANGTVIPDQGSFTATFTGVQLTNYIVAEPVAVDAVGTTSSIAATGILTLGALSSGKFVAGQFISDTGNAQIPVSANAQILYQISGTAGGGAGATFQTNYNAVVTSTTITGTAGKIGSITSWGQG
jgi:hypothetical protein